MPPRLRLAGIMLVVIFAVTTALIGFAHRAPMVADQATAALTLAGFDPADICGSTGVPGHDDCPLCHLTGGAVLPPKVMAVVDAELRLVAEMTAPKASAAIRPVRDPARGLRGPPVV